MSRKVAVFNLPRDVREREVEDLFRKYGRVNRVAVRDTRGGNSTMAFVEFQDERDAEDAVRERHNYVFDGGRIRVEISGDVRGGDVRGGKGGSGGSRGDSRSRGRGPPARGRGRGDSRGRGGGGHYREDKDGGGKYGDKGKGGKYGDKGKGKGKGYDKDGRGSPAKLKNQWFKVQVNGLPAGASWQDVKDFLRPAGNVKFTEVKGDVGYGGFEFEDEAKNVAEDMNGKDFRSRDGATVSVAVEYAGGGLGAHARRDDEDETGNHGGSGGGGHSGGKGGDDEGDRARSRSRSPRRSEPRRSASPSHSRHHSPGVRESGGPRED